MSKIDMEFGFTVYKTELGGRSFWLAESTDLKGCIGQGDTLDEALDELAKNEIEWIETAKEVGITIPEPTIGKNNYSGKFMTRISAKEHKEAVKKAKEHGVSLNQYVNDAIVKKNAEAEIFQMLREELDEIKSLLMIAAPHEKPENFEKSRKIAKRGA